MDRANLAPVAIFTYNRLDNTRKTIEALKENKYADQTIVYIFSDGGKDEKSWKKVNRLRTYLKTVTGFRKVIVVERPENYYLEKNIIEGVSSVIEEHGKVIVLEDDICTTPWFLQYMNDALDFYQNEQTVMHIAAMTYWDEPDRGKAILTPLPICWGWATWQDRWKDFRHYASREEAVKGLTPEDLIKLEYGGNFRCLRTLDSNPIPWDICWYITIYKRKGFCVVPPCAMSRNIGLYSGTHFKTSRIWGKYVYDRVCQPYEVKKFQTEIKPDIEYERKLYEFFKRPIIDYNLLGKFVRFCYLKWIKK